MRKQIRLVFGNITAFFMISSFQKIEGISSNAGKDQHILLWDFDLDKNRFNKKDDCIELNPMIDQSRKRLKLVTNSLKRIQKRFRLGQINIFTDNNKSYHAYCFTRLSFKNMITVLLHTDYIDNDFIAFALIKGKSVLRTSGKIGRGQIKLVGVLPSNVYSQAPKRMTKELYDCPIDKKISEINLELFNNAK